MHVHIYVCLYVYSLKRFITVVCGMNNRRLSGAPYPLLPSLSGFGILQAESSSTDIYDALEDVVEDKFGHTYISRYIHPTYIHIFIYTLVKTSKHTVHTSIYSCTFQVKIHTYIHTYIRI